MARLGRYFLADQPLHVIQRGNDRHAIFFRDDDYAWLTRLADRRGGEIRLHRSRLRLDGEPRASARHAGDGRKLAANHAVTRVALRAAHVNWAHKRTGTLWEGRYRAAPIDSDDYFLSCCRYIELNPVRAGMVAHPRDYLWSSYRAHADGAKDALAREHPLYRRLGKTAAERQQEYRNLFRGKLPEAFVEALRAATNGGWALGGERFKKQIAKMASRRVAPLPKGRPPANPTDKRQLNLL